MLVFVTGDLLQVLNLDISRVPHAKILLTFVATVLTVFIFGITFLVLKSIFFFSPINSIIGKLCIVKCYLFVIPGFIIAGLMDNSYYLC